MIHLQRTLRLYDTIHILIQRQLKATIDKGNEHSYTRAHFPLRTAYAQVHIVPAADTGTEPIATDLSVHFRQVLRAHCTIP
jgi:hypothetical protein